MLGGYCRTYPTTQRKNRIIDSNQKQKPETQDVAQSSYLLINLASYSSN